MTLLSGSGPLSLMNEGKLQLKNRLNTSRCTAQSERMSDSDVAGADSGKEELRRNQ